MRETILHRKSLINLVKILLTLVMLGGCLPVEMGATVPDDNQQAPETDSTTVSSEPYYPPDFKDILIPAELDWERERSVSINSDSYSGGILFFSGRVEVNSLTDFFINSMAQNDWQTSGSVKARDVLLAFTKENGSCLIRIVEGGSLGKTDVFIYITHTGGY